MKPLGDGNSARHLQDDYFNEILERQFGRLRAANGTGSMAYYSDQKLEEVIEGCTLLRKRLRELDEGMPLSQEVARG